MLFPDGDASGQLVRVVRSRDEQIRIMTAIHSGYSDLGDDDVSLSARALGGHVGINAVQNRLRVRYTWWRMVEDVKNFVRTCETCQPNKLTGALKAPQRLHQVKIPYGRPWKQLGIDLVGPLKETPDGYLYVLTQICYFTKFCVLTPLPDKQAITVAESLYRTQTLMGPAAVHITDQGTEFCNVVSEALCRRSGTTHRVTSPYHPQANGLCERLNRDTMMGLRKMVEDRGQESRWGETIEAIQWSHNTTVKRMIGTTPYELMYGKPPELQQDVREQGNSLKHTENSDLTEAEVISIEDELHSNMEEKIEAMMQTRQEMYDAAEEISQRRGKKVKEQWEKKHKGGPPLEIGTRVYRENTRLKTQKGGKLLPRWFKSVFVVVNFNPKNQTYRVKNEDSGLMYKKAIPACQLKVVHMRPDDLKLSSEKVLSAEDVVIPLDSMNLDEMEDDELPDLPADECGVGQSPGSSQVNNNVESLA